MKDGIEQSRSGSGNRTERSARRREIKKARYETDDYGEVYDRRYAGGLNQVNTLVERSWIKCNLPDGALLLDAGAGTGRFAAGLIDKAGRVVALDSSASMLDALGRKAPALSLVRSDIYSIPVAHNSFDAVVCMHVLFHLPDWDQALGELARVVRPGGLVFFEMRSGQHVRLAGKAMRLLGLSPPGDGETDPALATVHETVGRVREVMECAGLEPVKTLSYDLGHSYYLRSLSGILEKACSRSAALRRILTGCELSLGRVMPESLTYRILYMGRKR